MEKEVFEKNLDLKILFTWFRQFHSLFPRVVDRSPPPSLRSWKNHKSPSSESKEGAWKGGSEGDEQLLNQLATFALIVNIFLLPPVVVINYAQTPRIYRVNHRVHRGRDEIGLVCREGYFLLPFNE
jgi:hypothetical protein